jgi:alkylation response protein AidB-like acyl-CoA dehydrogenase
LTQISVKRRIERVVNTRADRFSIRISRIHDRGYLDFSLTEDQIQFKEHAIKFAKQELNDGVKEREKNSEFNDAGWKKCAEFGLQGMSMPEQYGGLQMDILTCLAAMEGLGYACKDSGLLFVVNSHIWTCEAPILKFGTDAQKEKYLRRLIDGSIKGGHAMTEPNSGSDAFSMKCKAEQKGNKYILNGAKTFITNAPIADILLVFAVTNPKKGFAGVSAFIVERGFPGFSTGKPLEMMGLKTCPIGGCSQRL